MRELINVAVAWRECDCSTPDCDDGVCVHSAPLERAIARFAAERDVERAELKAATKGNNDKCS